MLNQSFTVDNFRKIFDYENRKGRYLEGRYFPEIEKITQELKTCAGEFKNLKKEKLNLSLNSYEDKKQKLNEQKQRIKEQKEKLLTRELEKISNEIHKDDFSVKLIQIKTPMEKPVYSIDKSDCCSYFLIKQIQYNIERHYKVQQSNRYNIVCQLRSLLNNNFPKYIIRTDIKDFYENICRKTLIEKMNQDGLLTLSSRKFINQILSKYGEMSGSDIGIPRGIGISAYLAELYMRDFDEAIKKHPEIIFYARYVDDIIAIYAPKPNSDCSCLLDEIRNEAQKLSLTLNKEKTKEMNFVTNLNGAFEYLGYKFDIKNGTLEISISKNKINRYKKRIQLTFNDYLKTKSNEKLARKMLIKRLRFITGNTRLSNNKSNALVGSYFSNSLITNSSSLSGLDKFVATQIDKINPSLNHLKTRLLILTFVNGWLKKRFYKFFPQELQEIVKVWKNVR